MAQKFFKKPFAFEGDKEPIPEQAQADGRVSYNKGYTYEYERDLEADPLALPIERNKFNQLQYDVTRSLQDYQIYAYPPYITAEDNGGEVYRYPLGGVCRYDDGAGLKTYVSTKVDNAGVPSISGVVQNGWAKVLDAADGLVFQSQAATSAKAGVVRLATEGEAKAGVKNDVAVTPYQMAANSASSVVNLVAVAAAAPAGTFVTNSKYFNTVSKQIFSYTAGAWGNPQPPAVGVVYTCGAYMFLWDGGILANMKYDIAGFYDFFEQSPPQGFMVRNGALLQNASSNYPLLYEYLQKPANLWKCLSEDEWQARSALAEGVGGVPYFVLDIDADTVRLPDTRGDQAVAAGRPYTDFDGHVGSWHGDAMRPIKTNGNFGIIIGGYTNPPFYNNGQYYNASGGGAYGTCNMSFDTTNATLTADENRTRAFAMLGCVYVGV